MTRAEKAEIIAQRILQFEKTYNQLKKEKVGKAKLKQIKSKIDSLKKRLKEL